MDAAAVAANKCVLKLFSADKFKHCFIARYHEVEMFADF